MSYKLPDVKGMEVEMNELIKSINDEDSRRYLHNREAASEYRRQVKAENEYLAHHRWVCPPTPEDSIVERYSNSKLKISNIPRKEDSDSVFLDSDSLVNLACVAQNITLFGGPNYRTGHNFIKSVISNIKLIGEPTADGFAMKADLFDRYKNYLVLKAPREMTKYTEAAVNHEMVVGKVLNDLRSLIPNFSYILGSFMCGPPIIMPPESTKEESDGKVVSWCRSGEQVKYLIYENVANAVSLEDYCRTCSGQEYIDIIMQLVYALMVAYKKHGFTHGDLHYNNVLVRDIGSDGFYIPYQGDFVYATKVGVFIDYGRSHVYLPGTNKASAGYKLSGGPGDANAFSHIGLYIDRPNPAYDCYRLLMASMSHLYFKNKTAYDQVKGIVHYFHAVTDDLATLMEQKDEYMHLPYYGTQKYVDTVRRFKHEHFIRYIREYCYDNNLNDPVVSGREYEDSLDESILFPNMVSTSLLRGDDTTARDIISRLDNIDEVFDLIEPILTYYQYIDDQTVEDEWGYKTKGHKKIVQKVFSRIQSERNSVGSLVDQELNHLKSKLEKMSPVTHSKLRKNDIMVLRSTNALKEYLRDMTGSIQYLDALDYIENRIEMINYLKNVLEVPIDTYLYDEISSLFRKYDERNVIVSLLQNDSDVINEYLDNKESRRPLDKIDYKLEEISNNLRYAIPMM